MAKNFLNLHEEIIIVILNCSAAAAHGTIHYLFEIFLLFFLLDSQNEKNYNLKPTKISCSVRYNSDK